MSKKIAVLLSGCGVFDGSEIHEAVLTLLELDKAGAQVTCIAADIKQFKTVNHLSSTDCAETRNVLEESARISRGEIENIADVKGNDFDALIIPGGFGAALNSCTFAIDGPQGSINPDIASFIQSIYKAGKPIGAMCIAPALVALALKNEQLELTVGSDAGVASAIETLGNKHVNCETTEMHVDEKNNIVTTPAYMTGAGIAEIHPGITKLVAKIIEISSL